MASYWIETGRMVQPDGAIPPLQQHPAYAVALAGQGAGCRFFSLSAGDGSCRGAALVLMRHWPLLGPAAILARGPLWAAGLSEEDRRDSLARLLDRLRAMARCVVVTPDPGPDGADPLEDSGWLATMTRCTLARLDLRPEPAALRAAMHGKWRNRLVRAEAAGLDLRQAPFSPRRDTWLLETDSRQARARGYRQLTGSFVTDWCRAGGDAGAQLFTAVQDGRPIAAMLFLVHGAGATYHIGWSGPDGRARHAHTLLLWRAMLWLRDRGVCLLDLDTIDTETAPGLARFKLGSGARPVRLGAMRLSAPGTRLFAGTVGRAHRAGLGAEPA